MAPARHRPAAAARRPPLLPAVLLLFLLSLPPQASALLPGLGAVTQWGTLISLSHSLMLRVANARSERGDRTGAERARAIAGKLSLPGRGGGMWSMGWDFARNYAWRGGGSGSGGRFPAEEIWELLSALGEVAAMRSDGERARWASRNYQRLISAANASLNGLLRWFSQSGPLREMVVVLRSEVREGDLIRDCLEVGAKDLEGLATVARNLFFGSSRSNDDSSDL